MSSTPNVLSVITNALIEAEWLAQGEQPEPQDSNFVVGKMNDLFDEWAAQERYVFAKLFSLFTLVPNLSPHTIGPGTGATFPLSNRPVRIDGCTIVISNADGTTTDIPVNSTRDADWWNLVRIKNLASQIPTDLYYQPDVPNGSLFFWPVPNQNYQTRIESWQTVGQIVTPNDQLVLPPAYRKAITLTLAQELSGPRSGDPALARAAAEARSAVWGNNAPSPTMSTAQAGMAVQGARDGRPDFNFLDGTPW